MIAAGDQVPPFTLRRTDLEPFTQDDLLGQRTLLVFFPFAFSSVCTDQLSIYHEVLGDLRKQGITAVYGVSCDNHEVQTAFRSQLGIDIELLCDWEPKGETCRALGVYHPAGMPERALLIVGPEGVVEWAHQAEHPGVLPGANLIFDALARS